MKTTKYFLITALMVMGVATQAQQKVNEDDLVGNWKLVIDIEEELEREADEEDNPFARMMIRGVSGLVEGILDNIDIYFDFQRDGEVKILVEAFDENEVDYAKWYINRNGELIIEDLDNDKIQFDDDDVWMMDGKFLVSIEEDGTIQENVYMTKIE
ncbi:MAG: hypothetical protein ACO2ZZ_08280 [Cyclobacteriaceae bacterium]